MSASQDDVVVRTATEADAADVAHVHVTTWQQGYDGLLPTTLLDTLSVDQRTQWWGEFLADLPERNAVQVVEVGGRVVGFVGTCPSRDEDVDRASTGEVAAIYLLRPWWDRGIGGALLDAGETALVAAGFGEATLWVLADNARAREFYERRGWTVDGGERTADLHGRLVVEVRYWRALATDAAPAAGDAGEGAGSSPGSDVPTLG